MNLLKRIKSIIKGNKLKESSLKLAFRERVELVMQEEKDFKPLYDYDKIEFLNEQERVEYLKDIITKYMKIKHEIEENRSIL